MKEKEKIHWTLSKLKLFSVKDIIKRIKRQVINWEQILTNYISKKGHI